MAFFQRFQTEELVLRVNVTKSTGEKAFIGDHLETKKIALGIFADF